MIYVPVIVYILAIYSIYIIEVYDTYIPYIRTYIEYRRINLLFYINYISKLNYVYTSL
jgi:hypothetical protein